MYNFDMIPQELKQLRQWVVWRAIEKTMPDGSVKVTKPPFRPSDPARQANVTEPGSWGTYDEAVGCYQQWWQHGVAGIGFVFTRDDPYFGLDMDTRRKLMPEFFAERDRAEEFFISELKTYAEISPSGDGKHFIGRGTVPLGGKQWPNLGLELYSENRFFTFTGNVFQNRTQITDMQSIVDLVWSEQPGLPIRGAGPVQDTTFERSLNYTDLEVIHKASNGFPLFSPRFNALKDHLPSQWSGAFYFIISTLDRITGSAEQVERIVKNSLFVTASPPTADGVSRIAKCQREFLNVYNKVRLENDDNKHHIANGRKIFEAMEKAKAERALAATEALRLANEAVGLLSKGAGNLLEAFPQLVDQHKVLTRPTGTIGEFVTATEQASFKPYMKFAIPATFAALSGILGRGWKLPGGSGLNLNFLLAAPSATGKTQTMKAWERFQTQACKTIPATMSGPPKVRIINSSTSSIQAMMEDFQEKPAVVWFVEECAAQLSAMSASKSTVEASLRDAFNQLYDCSMHGSMFSGPRSVAARKAQLLPINNLNVSTFWSTVTSKLDIFSEDALDGFLSRVIMIRHSDVGGDPVETVNPKLPPHLLACLVDLMSLAQNIDDLYKGQMEVEQALTEINTTVVTNLHWQLVLITDELAKMAIRGQLPPSYTAISRLPLTALRMSGVMAVVQNPYSPVISEEQLKWAFGYLLQNLVYLLSDIDQGNIGQGAKDDVAAVVRCVNKMLSQSDYKGLPGIPKDDLRNRLRTTKPFFGGNLSPSTTVRLTLEGMIKDGQLEEVTQPVVGRGRPRTLMCPVTTDPVWKG